MSTSETNEELAEAEQPPPIAAAAAVAASDTEELPADVSLALTNEDDENDANGSATVAATAATSLSALHNVSDELNVTETLAMSDSGSEAEDDQPPNAGDIQPETSALLLAAKSRFAGLVDTDSDGEEDEEQVRQLPKPMNRSVLEDSDSAAEAADENQPKPAKRHALVDTDSDEEGVEANKSDAATSSEASASPTPSSTASKSGKSVKRLHKKPGEQRKAGAKLAAICDSSSDEEAAAAADCAFDEPPDKSQAAAARPPKRASAREAEDTMRLIQSESQRLARETALSVPYHRPRQHSLQTFLSRRGVIKPADVRPDGSKAAAQIKMRGEELEEYARGLEERARESQRFYKSESSGAEEATVDGEKADKDEATEGAAAEPVKEGDDAEANEAATEEAEQVAIAAVETLSEEQRLMQKYADDSALTAVADVPAVSAVPTPTRLELLQQRVLANLAATSIESPSLRGSANTIIDLETGDVMPGRKSGPTELYERFLKHSARPKPRPAPTIGGGDQSAATAATGATLHILSTESGVLSMDAVVLPPSAPSEEIIQHSKPRSAFFKLKAVLGEKLAQKRRVEIEQRQMAQEKKCAVEEDEEDEEEEEKDGEGEEDEAKEVADGDCVEGAKEEDGEAASKVVGAEKSAAEDDESDDESDDDDDDDEEEASATLANGQKVRKRIVLADDSDNELPDPTSQADQSAEYASGAAAASADVADMLNICATNTFEAPAAPVVAANPSYGTGGSFMTQNADVTESQLVDLCSGVFATQHPGAVEVEVEDEREESARDDSVVVVARPTFESSSEDEHRDAVNPEEQSKKKQRSKKRKSKPTIAALSDDEAEEAETAKKPTLSDEEDGAENQPAAEDIEYDSEENEVMAKKKPATKKREANADADDDADSSEEDEATADAIVEYDSEENEVQVVRQTKKERQRRARAYIEAEAELSEEEWGGSSDEDEKQLDRMDRELGDEEHFDQDQLRSELGRIHMRRMLDADAREVKIIAEELLHTEEEEAQRERQFRWKGLNDSNWAADELARGGADGGDAAAAGAGSDEENEEAWRKMRHEREQMLKEMGEGAAAGKGTGGAGAAAGASVVQESGAEASVAVAAGSPAVRKRKITVIRSAAAAAPQLGAVKETTFLIGQAKEFQGTRNSFLGRDEQTLARLANMVKNEPGVDSAAGGNVGLVAGVSSRGQGNFVFSTISPAPDRGDNSSKNGAGKRKSGDREAEEEADEEDTENRRVAKRPKKSAGGVLRKRLLDSL